MDAKSSERSPAERIPVVYIIGPYRAPHEYQVHKNIHRARTVAVRLLELGAMPVCPHLNTAWMGGVVPDGEILDGDLELLKRCDGAVAIENWASSEGSTDEMHLVQSRAMPCCVVLPEALGPGDQISDLKLREFVMGLKSERKQDRG
jgi:hypothetical protein